MDAFGAGPLFALTAAALWAVSPMFMASAGRRVGSFPVVLLRSLLATLLLVVVIGIVAAINRQWPAMPDARQAAWLAVSGLIGMGIGDVLIYEAFVILGPRRTTQTLVLAPAVAVIIGWVALGEALSGTTLLGVVIILGATSYAVLAGQRVRPDVPRSSETTEEPVIAAGESSDIEARTRRVLSTRVASIDDPRDPPDEQTRVHSTRREQTEDVERSNDAARLKVSAPRSEPGRVTMTGLLCAVGGAICMAAGAVTGRQAFVGSNAPVDTYVATLVRVGIAGIFLWLAPVVRRQVPRTLALLRDRHVLTRVSAGTLLGPFIGMSCYVAALKTTPAGLVSVLVATSPLFAIPVTIIRYRARIGWDVWLAAAIAVVGAAVLFMG